MNNEDSVPGMRLASSPYGAARGRT